jgi:hypothetical protein
MRKPFACRSGANVEPLSAAVDRLRRSTSGDVFASPDG